MAGRNFDGKTGKGRDGRNAWSKKQSGSDRKRNVKSKGLYAENKKGDNDYKYSEPDNNDIIENQIEGKNPVMEAIKSGRTIDKILIARGNREGSVREIIARAREQQIVIMEVDKHKLDEISGSGAHQGIIAYVTPYKYVGIDDIIERAKAKNEDPFIIILDEITDPHNFGAIIRTAECCGAHGIIIPKRRAVGLTPAVIKASAGAVEYMAIAKVTNLASAIEDLKSKGIWVAGADSDGAVLTGQDLKGPIAIVIGNEGSGIGRLVKERCDFLVSIPMKGNIESLNASVAAGIVMYEVVRQRNNL